MFRVLFLHLDDYKGVYDAGGTPCPESLYCSAQRLYCMYVFMYVCMYVHVCMSACELLSLLFFGGGTLNALPRLYCMSACELLSLFFTALPTLLVCSAFSLFLLWELHVSHTPFTQLHVASRPHSRQTSVVFFEFL